MTTRPVRRRAALARKRKSRGQQSKDLFFTKRCKDIRDGKFVPIIGDSIRNAHIFDYDGDRHLGIGADASQRNGYGKLNVTEQLTHRWATDGTMTEEEEDPIAYPLTDDMRIARVAQFYSLTHNDPVLTKEDYLSFLKAELLSIAYEVAEKQGDD